MSNPSNFDYGPVYLATRVSIYRDSGWTIAGGRISQLTLGRLGRIEECAPQRDNVVVEAASCEVA